MALGGPSLEFFPSGIVGWLWIVRPPLKSGADLNALENWISIEAAYISIKNYVTQYKWPMIGQYTF